LLTEDVFKQVTESLSQLTRMMDVLVLFYSHSVPGVTQHLRLRAFINGL